MTDAEQRAIEKRLGRSLTPREKIFEQLERRDNRTPQYKMNYEDWKPIAAKPQGPTTIFDQALIEAEAAALAERIASMPPKERTVVMLKKARAEKLAQQESQAAHAARMASPEVARPLKALHELRDRMRWDPNYGLVEIEAVDRAIAQYETPGSDLKIARDMLNLALTAEREIKQTRRDSVLDQMQKLGALREELDAALLALDPDAEQPAEETQDDAPSEAAWRNYQTLKADESATPEQKTAARDAWAFARRDEVKAAKTAAAASVTAEPNA